jgi:DNA-binding NarL/FixJ family response regulator
MPTTHPVSAAVHCGRYDCGHILRSDDRALKRAAFLYLAREGGVEVSIANEAADVLAALALMRAGRPCSEVREYRTPGVRSSEVRSPATVSTVRLSDEVREVMALAVRGYDIPEIAEMTYRSVETVRSHFAKARKATDAHSTMAAGVALVRLGIIAY